MLKLKIIKNSSFKDNRGFYWTTWKKGTLKNLEFNHDKFSISKKKVLRGLHCDFKSWKLVSCIFGEVILYVINFDENSKNYLQKKIF